MIFGQVCVNLKMFFFKSLLTNHTYTDNSSIISQLNPDVLRQIQPIFADLQLNVKLKLLLSFLHISRRNLDEVTYFKCIISIFLKFSF